MRQLAIIVTLCVGCHLAAGAQSSFTERLQQSKNGEGKVTITQDKAITDLVNGPSSTVPVQKSTTPKPIAQTQKPSAQHSGDKALQPSAEQKRQPVAEKQDVLSDTTATDARKKVIKGGYKINGYRVQVYAGGNSRDARQKAERTGREINSLFPGEPVYVHFYSPRWICRMGNYRTYEEAHQMLNAVKKLGYLSAIIVKGKITVPYLPTQETP